MADRPDTIKEWASNTTALKNPPPTNSFKRTGFSVSQPPVNFFNWVFYNIYKWIDFFDEHISESAGTQGGLTYAHSSTRPRIEIPFTLNDTNVLSQIEVLKKTEESVGGVSGTEYTGSGAVTAGMTTEGTPTGLTFSSSPFDLSSSSYFNSLLDQGNITGVSGSIFDRNTELSIIQSTLPGTSDPAIRLSGNSDAKNSEATFIIDDSRGDHSIFIYDFYIVIADGAIRPYLFMQNTDITGSNFQDFMTALFGSNNVYLIGSQSENISTGECVIWELPNISDWTSFDYNGQFTGGVEALRITDRIVPVYKNLDITPSNFRYFRIVSSYSVTGGGMSQTTGSSLGATVDISTVTWNISAYSYSPGADTLSITLDPTQTDAALFHTFKIRDSNGDDLITLLSTDATFASGVWTWTVNSDPITADGTYTFVFQTSGSGVEVFRWAKVTAGISVEDYSGVKYLNVSSTAAANNDMLFVRKT